MRSSQGERYVPTSIPSNTSPNTTCFPSSCGAADEVMKNCEPFVSLPMLHVHISETCVKINGWQRVVLTGVRHAQQTRLVVLQVKVLVREALPKDGLATSSISVSKVAYDSLIPSAVHLEPVGACEPVRNTHHPGRTARSSPYAPSSPYTTAYTHSPQHLSRLCIVRESSQTSLG